jgi:hypothetical protein
MWRYSGHGNPFDQKELIKFSYRGMSFVVHDYALGRIPYLHNMIQGCTGTRAPNAKKMVRAGNIDPNGLISKSIGFDFSTEALTVLLAWAYDKDTMHLLQQGVLPYEHWLTVAKFMTIADLDTDIEHIIACQTAQKLLLVPSKRWEQLTLVAKFLFDLVVGCVQFVVGVFLLLLFFILFCGHMTEAYDRSQRRELDAQFDLHVATELLRLKSSQDLSPKDVFEQVNVMRRELRLRHSKDALDSFTVCFARMIRSIVDNVTKFGLEFLGTIGPHWRQDWGFVDQEINDK